MTEYFAEHHRILVWVHVILAIYWLGPDWGVYVTSKYVARPDLPVAERRRFLQAALGIDIVPRTCLILMLPFGLLLAGNLGLSPLSRGALALTWVAFVSWLLLSWRVHFGTPGGLTEKLRAVDWNIRIVVGATAIAVALWSLVVSPVFGAPWLAAKVLGWGVLVYLGLALRKIMSGWAAGFARLAQEGSNPDTEAVFAGAMRRARPLAYVFWGVSASLAFLGVVKPF